MSSGGVGKVAIKYIWVLLVGVILIGISHSIAYEQYAHHFVRDVGIAIFVAYIVIITIEHRQRKELSDSINSFMGSTNEKIFSTILGIEFPQGMFDFVRDTVMRGTFYRTDTQVVYWIKKADDGGVVLEFDTSHFVLNLSGSRQTYVAPFFVEKDLGANPPSSSARTIELHIDGKRISEPDLKKADAQWEDTDDFVRFNYKVELAPRQKLQIRIKHTIMGKLASDTEVWRSIVSCSGVDFIINFPKGMVIGVDAIHPDGFRETCRTDTVICGKIARPLYPHNGFMFWWKAAPADSDRSP